jgi:uncharacterized protein YqgC (DUF456 family)
MDLPTLMLVLAALLVLTGLAGVLLPALPGAPVIFAGLLLAAWAEDFAYVGAGWLLLFAVFTGLIMLVDFIAGSLGARGFGASPRAATGAAIGALLGLLALPWGLFIGPFFGAVIGELSARRTLSQAGVAGIGATLGLVVGMAAKLALALAMVGLFAFARWA